mmetsp:Transcript_22674/g.54743  ORF Transcript_22674/g.54743 Transcript_22674/m.54743 type:complete len:89 (+) Transcript_22674:24-290(+)
MKTNLLANFLAILALCPYFSESQQPKLGMYRIFYGKSSNVNPADLAEAGKSSKLKGMSLHYKELSTNPKAAKAKSFKPKSSKYTCHFL